MAGLRRNGAVLAVAAALVASTPALAAASAAPAGAVAATSGRPGACGGAAIVSFAFKPRTVPEGATATLSATISNCTGRTFSGSLQTFGKLVCLVLDPVSEKVRVAPASSGHLSATYVAPGCAGTGVITGRLMNAQGKVVSTRQAKLVVVVAPGG
jgi:hypothetical protein